MTNQTPIFYVDPRYGLPYLAEQLEKNKIQYETVLVDPEKEPSYIRKLVGELRASKFTGPYKILSQLPMLRFKSKMYPRDNVFFDLKKRAALLDYIINNTPKESPKEVDEEAIVNLVVEELIKLGRTGIEDYMNKLDQPQRLTFVTGARLQRHYDAHMILDIGDMFNDMLKTKAKNLDPWIG
jgi:hypothetical protein